MTVELTVVVVAAEGAYEVLRALSAATSKTPRVPLRELDWVDREAIVRRANRIYLGNPPEQTCIADSVFDAAVRAIAAAYEEGYRHGYPDGRERARTTTEDRRP